MEAIRLGRTDMMVSRLGFGGIPIQRLTDDEAVTNGNQIRATNQKKAGAYAVRQTRPTSIVKGEGDGEDYG